MIFLMFLKSLDILLRQQVEFINTKEKVTFQKIYPN